MTPVVKAAESVMSEWILALRAGIPITPVIVKETCLHPGVLQVLQDMYFIPSL